MSHKLEAPCKRGAILHSTGYCRIAPARWGTNYEHRAVLSDILGRPLLRGEYACHKCDNKWCVEPTHLYLGDASTNGTDATARGQNNTEEHNEYKRKLMSGVPKTEEHRANISSGKTGVLATLEHRKAVSLGHFKPLVGALVGVKFTGLRWQVKRRYLGGRIREYFPTLLDAAAFTISYTNRMIKELT